MVRAYGTLAARLLEGAHRAEDLGRRFGWNLTEREVRWLMEREWAVSADDVLWRRSKLGLRLDAAEAARLADFMAEARVVGPAENRGGLTPTLQSDRRVGVSPPFSSPLG